MSRTEAQYEQALRRVLHAAADGIEPVGDGLERIRARLTAPQPLPLAWLLAAYAACCRTALSWLEPLSGQVKARSVPAASWAQAGSSLRALAQQRAGPGPPGTLGALAERFRLRSAPPRRHGWLRPAAAMAVAVCVIAAGVLATRGLPNAITSSGLYRNVTRNGSHSGTGRPGSLNGQGTRVPSGPSRSGGATSAVPGGQMPGNITCPPSIGNVSGSGGAGTSPAVSPSPTASPSPASTDPVSPSPRASPSPTPSPTVSPSTSPSPSPSPAASPASGSASGAPGSSASSGSAWPGAASPDSGYSHGMTSNPAPGDASLRVGRGDSAGEAAVLAAAPPARESPQASVTPAQAFSSPCPLSGSAGDQWFSPQGTLTQGTGQAGASQPLSTGERAT